MGDDNVNNEGRHGQDTNTKMGTSGGKQARSGDEKKTAETQAEKPGSNPPGGRS